MAGTCDISALVNGVTPFVPETTANKSTNPALGTSDSLYPSQNAVKSYADSVAQGLSAKDSVVAATAAALPANSYNNGVLGVGAFLTASPASGALTIDGVAVSIGDRILIKDEGTPARNGIYTVTTVGTGLIPWVITRSLDSDDPNDFDGAFVFVESGTVNTASGWVCTTTGVVVVGTTAITFTQFSGAGEVTAGTGLNKSGNTLSIVYGTTAGSSAQGNDSRLSDARTPTAHAASHATGGSDPVSPASIGAQPALGFTAENVANKTTDGTLAANSDTLYPSEKATKTYVDAISPTANPAVTEPGNTVGNTPDYFYICNKYATGNSFTSTQFVSANQLICFQFHLSQRIQLTKFVFEMTQANSGKKIGVGIYSADGSTLLAEGRFTSGASAGVQGVAPQGGSVILSRGMYWWAAACDDTGTLAARFIIPDATYDAILNSQVVHKGTAANAMVGGAMPASLGVVTASSTSRILVGLIQS